MRIRTRLRLNAWIVSLAALLAFFLLAWSFLHMVKSDQDESLVREMRLLLGERQVLREDYLYLNEERARVQWLTHSDRIGKLLAQAGTRLGSAAERALLVAAEKDLDATNIIFARIVEARADWSGTQRVPPPGEDRRIDKLKTRTLLFYDNLSRLEALINEGNTRARNRTFILLQLFIIMGVALTVGNAVLLNRMLARRLAELREGAERIGSGNLDHRLAVWGDDELAELAELTNRMAANLQGSFTSLATLEAEMASRREVEEALLDSQESLQQAEWRTSIINRIANVFLSVSDEAMYAEVLEIILEALRSRFGIFGYIDASGNLVVPSMTRHIWNECQVDGKSIIFPPGSWGESIWGRAIREKCPIASVGPFQIPAGHVAIDNFLTVPILFAGRVIGLLSVANSDQGYDENSINLLEAIAAYTSPILNAQLQRQQQEQERDKAEKELRLASEYNRNLIEVSLDPLVTIAADGKITDVNAATEKITGQSRGALIGTDFCDYFTEPERARTAYQLAFRDGSVRDYSLEIRRPDGQVAQVLYNASVYRNSLGEPGGVFAAARDVTERQQVEEALLKLSIAVDQSPVSIIITDASGTIEFVNPRFTQLTGYEKAEVLGKNPRILQSGETPPELYRHLWSTISAGKVWQGAFHNLKKNGEPFLEYATIAPVKNTQGVITNYIAIKEDVTERRNLENQLRQSQKMEAIGTLAGGIAHDFNNILTAIIGFGSLLEMKMAEGDPLHHNVTQILNAADRAANLTRSLLAFSRKQQIATRVLNLNDIVAGLEKMLHRLIREDIELTVAGAAAPLPVLVDAGQVEQVLINLVTNARDAMPDGGTLSITTSVATIDDDFGRLHGYGEPGDYAILVVADSGTGMAESVRQRIFDPFFSTKEVGKGTGLGLAVCYGIIKQHGGYINCYSEPGRGTTFRIYLPLVHGEAEKTAAGSAVPLEGGTETILLAEDEPTVRELTTKILREFGYTVIEACDGAEAVALFREEGARIDLCLFDVIMPNKKGWEALAEIRGISPEIKALFMSGYQADFDQLQDMTQSDAGFIAKPVVPRDLLRKIRALLDS